MPSLVSDDEIQPHHLRLIGNKIIDLPNIFRENYGTLTWVSPYVQPARSTVEVRPNFHPEPNSSLPEILEDKLIERYNENNSNENFIIGTDQLNSIYLNTKEIKYSRDIKSDVSSHVYFINKDAKCFCLIPNCGCPTLSRKTSKSLQNKHGMKPSVFLEKHK